ncbi:hypothetical protein WBP06_06730 [Novosphingobium sp. BL-8H]
MADEPHLVFKSVCFGNELMLVSARREYAAGGAHLLLQLIASKR